MYVVNWYISNVAVTNGGNQSLHIMPYVFKLCENAGYVM